MYSGIFSARYPGHSVPHAPRRSPASAPQPLGTYRALTSRFPFRRFPSFWSPSAGSPPEVFPDRTPPPPRPPSPPASSHPSPHPPSRPIRVFPSGGGSCALPCLSSCSPWDYTQFRKRQFRPCFGFSSALLQPCFVPVSILFRSCFDPTSVFIPTPCSGLVRE